MLKHHPHVRSDLRQVAIPHDDAGAIDADRFPIQVDFPGVWLFKPVDATYKCRFSRTRRSELADRLALVDLKADVRKHLDLSKPLRHPGLIKNLASFRHRPSYRRASATRPIELTPASIPRQSPQYRNTAVIKAANGT